MSGPSVYLTWPTLPTRLYPEALPHVLLPPVKERTFRAPFGIDKDLYNSALEPWLPLTFAALYIVTVFSLNAFNRNRDHKPWWIARQRSFQWFVVVHNVLLAIFSAATFLAMVRAIVHTWPEISGNPHAAASVADALCKINGPRGLGDATTFNTTINIWEVKNTAIRLGYDGNPDPTDVGRLWNEGLAFWGWLFYVSKFYEVLDTLIILAKGKRSATLQTYHHAGAMLCMWAGIRFMSPPIWMFVFINSAIHAMMYTYFTFSALGYRVPQGLKRALTSLQIAQFVFGASYAAAHLFVAYDIPIQSSYQVASIVERAASSVSSVAVAATSTVSSLIESPTPKDMGAFIKKMLLRAAGEEGLAERVRDRDHHLIPEKLEAKIEYFNEQTFETHHRTDWTRVNCIDTSGEAFAIYLNLLYLAPLTGLFVRFFYKAYTQRGKPRPLSKAPKQIADSSKQAEQETEQYIESSGEHLEDEIAKRGSAAGGKMRQEAHELHEQLRNDVEQMKQGKFRGSRRVSDRVASFEGKAKDTVEKGKEKLEGVVEKARGMANGSGSESPRESRSGSPQKEPGTVSPQKGEGRESPRKGGRSGSPRKEDQDASPQKEGSDAPPQKHDQDASTEKVNPNATPEKEPPSESPDRVNQSPSVQEAQSGSMQKEGRSGSPQKAEGSGSPQKESRSRSPQKQERSASPQKAEWVAAPQNAERTASPQKSERTPSPQKSERTRIPQKLRRNGSPQKKGAEGATGNDDSPRQQSKPELEPKPQANKGTNQPEEPKKQGMVQGVDKNALAPQSKDKKEPQPKKTDGKPEGPNRPGSSQQDKSAMDKNEPAAKQDKMNPSKSAGKEDIEGAASDASATDSRDATSKKPQTSGGVEPESDHDANNESEEQQDANMEGSQALRPGNVEDEQPEPSDQRPGKPSEGDEAPTQKTADKPSDDVDSDAMGQSGSIIDMAMEKANDARKDAETEVGGEMKKESEDPTAGAEASGQQWEPPGGTLS
ncbi:hypothetical protein LTR53_003507 [Teratosphaeriaceae sp. CCFEE 6253]|nr:hypothetical protein LTR53_003507 [Teratosphaeriaceae sp. CCFEE 6253]